MKLFISIRFSDPRFNHRASYSCDLETAFDIVSLYVTSVETTSHAHLLSASIQPSN